MKGWKFAGKKVSADGSTTLETLRAEKTRLEARLAELPGLISRMQHSIAVVQGDIDWLNSLNNRRAKDWEKENGKSREQAVYDGTNTVATYKAQLTTMQNELARIPDQITEIDRQLAALVQGESAGLTRGLTSAQAQQMGEIELQKEQNQIAHENAMQQVELQAARQQAATSAAGMSPQLKWGLIIGAVLLIAAIAGYVIYKRKAAAAAAASAPTAFPKL